MNSSATCRLNAALCERCFVMASILRKPSRGGQSRSFNLSTRRAALQSKLHAATQAESADTDASLKWMGELSRYQERVEILSD
jgi:hypothetical protein